MTPRGVGALLAGCLLVLGTTAAACSVAGPQQVVVSAAASLTEAFDELERTYEDDNPDVDIVLNLGGSQILAGQIVDGAPADLFASANPQSVRLVADAGLGQGDPIVLATNRLVIVVPAGNPQGVASLGDLVELDVVLGAEEVPVGAYAQEALDAAGVTLQPVSLEPDTRAVVSRVVQGDADAAIAYATDVVALDAVEGIELPADVQPELTYQVLLLTDGAGGFLEFLASTEAQQILRRFGFSGP